MPEFFFLLYYISYALFPSDKWFANAWTLKNTVKMFIYCMINTFLINVYKLQARTYNSTFQLIVSIHECQSHCCGLN